MKHNPHSLFYRLRRARVIEVSPGRFAPCVWDHARRYRFWKELSTPTTSRTSAEGALSDLRQQYGVVN